MKALSVLQPWAQLIVYGAKRFETRSWKTEYRGPLLIHAGKTFSPAARCLALEKPFLSKLRIQNTDQLATGAIIGIAILEDCIQINDISHTEEWRPEIAFGDFHTGRYAWKLTNPFPLAVPIPYRGNLGLVAVEDGLVDGVPEVRDVLSIFQAKQQVA